MKNRLFSIGLLVVGVAANAVYADNTQKLIERAKSAAPAMISDNATVMADGKVISEGSNGWICMPNTMPGDSVPMCNDGTWMELMTALGGQKPYSSRGKIGFSYMLQGDIGVSNSDPFHADPMKSGDYIKEGPHLMIIVPPGLLKGLSDDPNNGGPYVMWKDTPYAHIMVPLGERE